MGIFTEECYGMTQIQMKNPMIDWLPVTKFAKKGDLDLTKTDTPGKQPKYPPF